MAKICHMQFSPDLFLKAGKNNSGVLEITHTFLLGLSHLDICWAGGAVAANNLITKISMTISLFIL